MTPESLSQCPPLPIQNPWDRLPGEPALWYERFERYRLLGPSRRLEEAYRRARDVAPQGLALTARRPGGGWVVAARRWNWQERAEAWDQTVRDELRAREEQRRFDAREKRLGMIDTLLQQTYHFLLAAKIEDLPPSLAPAILPTLRVLFRDLLTVQRLEFDPAFLGTSAQLPGATLSVEDLRRAYDELKDWQERHPPTRAATVLTLSAEARARLAHVLAELYPDVYSARRIADSAGLDTQRLYLDHAAADNWHIVVREAEHTNRLLELIAVVRAEYGSNRLLLETLANL